MLSREISMIIRNLLAVLIFVVPPYALAEPAGIGFVALRTSNNSRASDSPQQNQSPKRWLVIKGHKQSNLEVWFQVTYATANADCYTHSFFGLIGGAPAESQRVIEMVRVAATDSDFILHLALDKYVAGSCGWRADVVDVCSFLPSLTQGPGSCDSFAFIAADAPSDIAVNEQCKLYEDDHKHGTFPICFPQPLARVETSEEGGSIDATIVIVPAVTDK